MIGDRLELVTSRRGMALLMKCRQPAGDKEDATGRTISRKMSINRRTNWKTEGKRPRDATSSPAPQKKRKKKTFFFCTPSERYGIDPFSDYCFWGT